MKMSFFINRTPDNTVDLELERAMQLIHDRMERMLDIENRKRQRFSDIESTPSYYR